MNDLLNHEFHLLIALFSSSSTKKWSVENRNYKAVNKTEVILYGIFQMERLTYLFTILNIFDSGECGFCGYLVEI